MAGRVAASPAAGVVIDDPAVVARNRLMGQRPVSEGPMFSFIGDVVRKMRSWEQGHIGWRTAARICEFLMLVGCFFSVAGVVLWTDGSAEYGRQKAEEARFRVAAAADINRAVVDEDVEVLRADLDQANARIGELTGEAGRLRGERTAAREETSTARRQVADLTGQVAALREQLAKAGDAGAAASEIRRLTAANTDMDRHLRALTTERDEIRTRTGATIDDLERRLAEARAGGDEATRGLERRLLEAQEQNAKLHTALTTSEAIVGRLRGERDGFKSTNADLDARLAAANHTAEEATARANGLAEKMKDMVNKSDANARITAATSARNTALGKVEELTKLMESMVDRGELEAAKSAMATKAKEATAAFEGLTKKLGGMVRKEDYDAANTRVKELEAALAAAQAAAAEKTKTNEQFEKLRSEMSTLRETAARESRTLRDAFMAQYDSLRKSYNAMVIKIEAMTPEQVTEGRKNIDTWKKTWQTLDIPEQVKTLMATRGSIA